MAKGRGRRRGTGPRQPRKNTSQRPVIGPGGYGPATELTESRAGGPVAHGTVPAPAAREPGDEVPVIVGPADQAAPADAGERLGVLRQEMDMGDGTVMPAGSAVWQDLGNPPAGGAVVESAELAAMLRGEIPAEEGMRAPIRRARSGGTAIWQDVRQPGYRGPPAALDTMGLKRRLDAISPGLADRLGQGLAQDDLNELAPQIAKAMKDAGAGPGTYSFTRDDPDHGSKIIVSEQAPGEVPAAFRRPEGTRWQNAGVLPEIAGTARGEYAVPDDLDRLSARVRGMLDSGMLSADVAAALDAEAGPAIVIQDTDHPEAGRLIFGSPENVALMREARIGPGRIASPGDWFLPPALAGLPGDANVPVIISTAGEKPPGAGEYLGRLTEELRTESGRVWPAGARVYRNLNPPEAYDDKPVLDDDSGPIVSLVTRPVRTSFQAEDILNKHARLARRYSDLDRPSISYLVHLLNGTWEDDPAIALRNHWPVDRQGSRGNDEGRQMARVVGRGLREALTYQVTAPMVARMREAENLMPGVQRLNEGDLPAPAGFAWLDDPWTIPVLDGLLPVRAVSWEKAAVPATLLAPGASYRSADAVRLIFWVYVPDTIAFGHFAEDDPKVRVLAGDLGDLIPHHIALLPFSVRFVPKETHEDESLAMIALIHSLWTFLGMELSASKTVRPSSQAHRKTILRSIRHDKVHVITLRRISYIYPVNGDGARRVINRQCKWWVDDFYRHIDPYRDEDEAGRPRRHEAEPAGRTGQNGHDDDDHDVCGVCLARGQAVRITQVHGHRRGPAYLPWKTPAKGRTLRRLSR